MPKAPPSLNSISGLSHWQIEEDDRRRRLEQVLCGLPLRPEAASKTADLARKLDEAFLFPRWPPQPSIKPARLLQAI